MKNHNLVNGSSAGLAALIQVDTTVSFLLDRQQVTNVVPFTPTSNGGYVWKRIFLKRTSGRGE